MSRNIRVEALDQTPIEQQRIELVERKGIGHPDSLMDGIAESVSRALSRAYLEECGAVLHHNTDQGEVVGGRPSPPLAGGRSSSPSTSSSWAGPRSSSTGFTSPPMRLP